MSRDRRALQRDQDEAEVDARLRRELQEQQDEDERAERVATATKAKAASLMSRLTSWKQENISSASNAVIDEPKESRVGTFIL